MKTFLCIACSMMAWSIDMYAETFTDSTITFSFPSDWKPAERNDSMIKFDAGESAVFTLEHIYTYNGDAIKLAEDRKAEIEQAGGDAVIENATIGNVFAVKMTEQSTVNGELMHYVSYLYRDRRSAQEDPAEDPTVVSVISFGDRATDFTSTEALFAGVYKSIQFKERTYKKPGKYSFNYPVTCSVKEFTAHSLYVVTNAPIFAKDGSLLKGFFIGESPPEEKADIKVAVPLKVERLRHGHFQVVVRDTTFGGQQSKVIHYQSTDGTNNMLMYVSLKGSLYWFSFEPSKDAEERSYYKAADLIMRSFKFED